MPAALATSKSRHTSRTHRARAGPVEGAASWKGRSTSSAPRRKESGDKSRGASRRQQNARVAVLAQRTGAPSNALYGESGDKSPGASRRQGHPRVVSGSVSAGVCRRRGLARHLVAARVPGVTPRSAAHPGLCTDGLPGRGRAAKRARSRPRAEDGGHVDDDAPRGLRDRGYDLDATAATIWTRPRLRIGRDRGYDLDATAATKFLPPTKKGRTQRSAPVLEQANSGPQKSVPPPGIGRQILQRNLLVRLADLTFGVRHDVVRLEGLQRLDLHATADRSHERVALPNDIHG